jgi:site-specific DNA-methyltransferase (adenine-specific)
MKEFPENHFDLCVTDPPYGIKRDKGFNGFEGFGGIGKKIRRRQYGGTEWDVKKPSREYFDLIFMISRNSIIFGGNYFTDVLPQRNHWLFWDKQNTMPTFGDGELIYTTIKRNSVKRIVYRWNGLIGKEKERHHPTQKPVDLIYILLKKYGKKVRSVIDPYAGVGTTGVACEKLGLEYVIIEQIENYCQIAAERIQAESQQGKLFETI